MSNKSFVNIKKNKIKGYIYKIIFQRIIKTQKPEKTFRLLYSFAKDMIYFKSLRASLALA